MKAEYAAPEIGVDAEDPVGLKKGENVSVETNDEYVAQTLHKMQWAVTSLTGPSADGAKHPQKGKLIGLSRNETVLQLDNGVRVHFPRVGYVIRKA